MSTITKGLVSTQESAALTGLNQDSLVIDMREEVSMADEDESQFSTFTMKAASGEATREKINWREKDYFPRLATVGAAYTTGATTITLTAGHGARVRRGDVLRNMITGECIWVQSVTGDVVTTSSATAGAGRAIGKVAAAAGNIGDYLLIASNASPQGADFPDTAILPSTTQSNYTQIFRHGYTFSRTAKSVNYYGRSEPDQESALKLVEHKRAIEYSGFWGAKGQFYDTGAAPATGEVVGMAGGLYDFILTNKQDMTSPVLDVNSLDSFLKLALQRSSRNIVMYCAPTVAMVISKFNRGGQGTAWRPDPQNRAGLKVDAFMSGVYGYEIPIVVKKDWNDFQTASKQFGGYAFIVDHNRVVFRTLTGGSTKLLTNRQLPGGDRVSEEWLTEATWEIRNETSHGYIWGVT